MLRVFDWSSKTRNDVARILSSQPVSAMGCHTRTIFNSTSMQIVSLKIVHCDITFRKSLRFLYYASLSTCCQNLEKNWVHWKNLGESGDRSFRGLTEKSVDFSTLATSNIKLLLFFGEVDQ